MKKMFTAFLALMVMAVSCAFFQESVDQLYNSGLETLNKGDYYGAIESFNRIDSLYPDSPYGYYGRAQANVKDRREIDALNEYLRILTKNSDFAPGLKALAIFAAKSDHPHLAVDISSQYNGIEDDSLAVSALNAELFLSIGEFQLARTEMAKITSGKPGDSEQQLFYSKLLLHEGELEKSLSLCSQAVVENRNNIEVLMETGNIYAAIGLFDSAATFYREIIKAEKVDYYQKADVAEAFIKINYLADAFGLIEKLEQVSYQNNIVPFLRTKLLLAQGRNLEAKEYYSKTISRNKITPAQHLFVAEVKWKSKDIQGTIIAMEHADLIAEAERYHLGLRNEITLKKPEFFLSNGDWRSVQGILASLEGLLPLDFKTIYLKSGMALLSDNKAGAEESLTRLEILVEDNPARLVKFANLYMQADSLDKAAYYYDRALTNDKINAEAIAGKVNVLKRQEKYNDAIDFLENQNQMVVYNRLLYPELISLYKEKGNLKKARDLVESLINIAPGDIDRYALAIELAIEDNHPEDIDPIIKRCLENNPGNGFALHFAGEQYMETGQKENAEKYLHEAIPTGILLHDLYYRLGLLMEENGEVDSALIYFEKSGESNLYFGKPYGRIAAVMINSDDIDKKTLAKLMNYVRLSQRSGKNAEDFITMGRAQIIQSRFKAAGNNFKKALEMDSHNPVYNYYTGTNYINLDSLPKAKTFLNKAIKYGLSGELKSKAEDALGKL